jgi:hypothetical protein
LSARAQSASQLFIPRIRMRELKNSRSAGPSHTILHGRLSVKFGI